MIRKIPLTEHYYKESEIDALLNEKADDDHDHGNINNDGTVTANTNTVNKVIVTDLSNAVKSINKLPADKVTHQDISGKVNTTDIKDNLISTDTDKPLSAKQGKELKTLVDTKANSNDVYTKSQTLTTTEINQAIAEGVGNVDIFEVVQELPTTNIKGNKFYLTPNGENINKNVYDINIYVNNNWETIDSLEFDIDNYSTTSEISILLDGKVDKIDGKQLSKNDFTDALKNKLENDVLIEHQSLTNYIQKSQTSGLVKNDGTIDTNTYLTEHQSLTNYIQKSQTSGLVKNDGTIDTRNFLTQHQSLQNYIQKSQVSGLIKNDGTIDTNNYLTNQSLINYVQKSQTSGLIKNDGTVDTNNYLTKEEAPKSPNYGFIDSNLILHLIYVGTEISTTKTIMQSGDNNPITVIVSDEDGNPLEDIPVEFYINGAKVGQTTNTNSNGVASYPYQGNGSGKIEIQVKIGSFVSVPCNVLDTLFYDEATSEVTSKWYNPNNISVSWSDDGTLLEVTDTTAGIKRYWTQIGGSGYWRDTSVNYCVEFDITYENDNGWCGVNFGDGTVPFGDLNDLKTSDSASIKLITDGNTIKSYYNGTYVSGKDKTMSQDWGVNFYTYRATKLTIKNIKIYPI